ADSAVPVASGLVAEQFQKPGQLLFVVEVELDLATLITRDPDPGAGVTAEVVRQPAVTSGTLAAAFRGGGRRRRPAKLLRLPHRQASVHDLLVRPGTIRLCLGENRASVTGGYRALLQRLLHLAG